MNNSVEGKYTAAIKEHQNLFVKLIRERLGIIIHQHQYSDLQKLIEKACVQFNYMPQDYLEKLMSCSHDSSYIEYLISGITVGETYFFRDKNQMNLLQNTILPAIIKNKIENNNLLIRIWSAGCASGEEIYTIAILLNELLPNIENWKIQLLGTDINTKVLQKALEANYSEWSMRSIPEYYKKKYFTFKDKQYGLTPTIANYVEFKYLNLNDDSYPSIYNGTNAQDLILCRNVLIYFDSNRITSLMKKISNCLVEGGYLLLGASDPINLNGTNLIFHHEQGTLFSRSPGLIIPAVVVEKPINKTTPKELNLEKTPPQKKILKQMHLDRSMNPDELNKLLKESRWQEVLNLILMQTTNKDESIFVLNAKATALANLGKLKQAAVVCQDSLALDMTNIQTYFIKAMVCVELNLLDEAEEAIRKMLFLDHQYVMGHYQLGLLLLRKKQHNAGLKSLKNALTIAEKQNPKTIVVGCEEDLHYGHLAEILKREIELHTTEGVV